MIWQAFNEVYHTGRDPRTFEGPARTRGGRALLTDSETEALEKLAEQSCANPEAAVDSDNDGQVDFCDPALETFTFSSHLPTCPSLYESVDANQDGVIDGCVAPTTTSVPVAAPPPGEPIPPSSVGPSPSTSQAPVTTTTVRSSPSTVPALTTSVPPPTVPPPTAPPTVAPTTVAPTTTAPPTTTNPAPASTGVR
jgi:hypothetical protein